MFTLKKFKYIKVDQIFSKWRNSIIISRRKSLRGPWKIEKDQNELVGCSSIVAIDEEDPKARYFGPRSEDLLVDED